MHLGGGRRGFEIVDEHTLAARAALYVSGAMSPAERENAERDLIEVAAFRDAVLKAAQQSGRLPDPDVAGGGDGWQDVAAGLAGLPQMSGALPDRPAPVVQPKPLPTTRSAAGERPKRRLPSRRSLLFAGLGFLFGVAAMVAGGDRLFATPTRTLSIAVLTDPAGTPLATVESRSDGALRVLMTATPGLPLTLLRLPDAGTQESRIGEVQFQGEFVFAGAGIGSAPADYRLARLKADGSGATVASGAARALVRD